jgi:hypothetical protein
MKECCPKCMALFEPHIYFIRCDEELCPMKSTEDKRSVLERLLNTERSKDHL